MADMFLHKPPPTLVSNVQISEVDNGNIHFKTTENLLKVELTQIFSILLKMSKNRQVEYKNLLETESKIDKLLQDSCKSHEVRFLHEYNNIKDAAQVIIGHVANIEGTSVTEIHKRFNLSE